VELRETALSTVGVTDPAEFARIREERYRLRAERINADPGLSPQMKRWMLDRTIWNARTAARECGWDEGYISKMSARTADTVGWSVSACPDLDTPEGAEAGRWREWTEWRGSHDTNVADGKLVKRPAMRHGRARSASSSRNKPSYVLGTPRVGKKDAPFGRPKQYTEEHIAQITSLVADGLNDEQIAERMGEPFTADKIQRLRWKHKIRRPKNT
jgi:hypothetical protein